MSISMRWKYGLTMMVAFFGLLGLPAGADRTLAQAEETRPQLETILYQEFLDTLTEPLAAAAPSLALSRSAVRSVTAAATGPVLRCLPTCSETDGRSLAIAGQNAATLSGSDLVMQIAVPAGSSSFTVGFFDGDSRGVDDAGISHWDGGVTTAVYEYTLYADPTAEGSGTTVVEMVPGSLVLIGSMMPDNTWIDYTIPTSALARTPSGHYFYRLRVRLKTPGVTTLNAFKVRTSAVLSGLTLDPAARPFSYIVNPSNQSDLRILYPSFPAVSPTTYDGSFNFFFEVPASREEITVWDGDFDYGKFDGSTRDADDPNTPNAPFLPSWSTVDTASEGVSVGISGSSGNPPDDRNSAGSSIYAVRAPSIRYDLIFPDGRVFSNENPSGNQEWEAFTITTDPLDLTQMDYSTATIPPGIYQLRGNGVDLVNLNALLLPFKLVCVDEQGVPCTPLRPFAVGDTVFFDADADHVQDPEEAGIQGVLLELRDAAGFLLATTTTDVNGNYRFEVDAGTHQIVVGTSNFDSGGALDGMIATIAHQITDTVTDNNVFTYDFGFRGTASLGDLVWLDYDADGVQNAGEVGLNGVTLQILDTNNNVIASATTAGNGNYSFPNLLAGTYKVRVVSSTLMAGATQTYDLDGTGTASIATVTVAAGQARTDADFGYRVTAPGTGTIGYWKNHPQAWPVSTITIGGVVYTRDQAIVLMGTPSRGDKSIDLFKQLVASKLSVLVGNNPSCIYQTIASADAWLATYPPGSNVGSSSAAWTQASPWHTQLDNYNNGNLCAPHRG